MVIKASLDGAEGPTAARLARKQPLDFLCYDRLTLVRERRTLADVWRE